MTRYIFLFILGISTAKAQDRAVIHINTQQQGARIAPTLHGIFFEEISHAGEGGLYAELIQNRGFEESQLPQGTKLEDGFIVPERTPHFSMPPGQVSDWKMEWPIKSDWPAWSATAGITLALTDKQPLNSATPHSLEVNISGKADLINEGFWGINTVAGNKYNLQFYARNYKGSITASLQSAKGEILASYTFNRVQNTGWKKYSGTLTATKSDPAARFVLSFSNKGIVYLDFVSLFPQQTFKQRSNGLRADLANYIADLKPAFIRWPGGCYVEGINIESAPDWKRTLGPIEKRPGTYSPWGYWSGDGFGYHEYLQYCEDIGAAALYVFNVGVSCDYRSGTFIPDEGLDSVIQNALDAIEYAIGPVTSRWGKVRAASGHPAPFPLKYVEVGNEQHGPRYALRYNRFYDAIKKQYPDISVIASMGIGDVNRTTLDSMQHVEMADEHAYKGAYWSFNHDNHFDKYKRGNWTMYVGEYATNAGVGTGNMTATLSDAVYMMAMERNADLVKMSSYAPLLVNVHDVDWPVNLINFDAANSFARISYYTIKMFNENRPDVNLATTVVATPSAAPAFTGGIGLSTWDTQSEYKDIEVRNGDQLLYKSDFVHKPEEWQLLRGKWNVQDSALAQTAEGAQLMAILKGKTFDTYTLTLKARKKDGFNAFIIPFAVKDSNTCLRAHIGSYVNQNCVFERVTGGYDVSDVSDQKRLKHPIEKDRWYEIRLEVKADQVDCYLDNEMLMSYREPAKVFAISGREENTGDIIVKIVNAGATTCNSNIELDGNAMINKTATLITLASDKETAENSFEKPVAYTPVQQQVSVTSGSFHLSLAPYSVNVLRLKDTHYIRIKSGN
ncbi:Alpha-L-arabinofuranosidase C-terminus [Chitinophaga sp. CF118]|uniref:alpha-L-arabinofuranosidase C-terminal domain-containing protein n=1 Tax=Chitinophaga sp. CF118 TaxID=1884367 RepID=UPI0008E67A4A|nr:alpha-L-arabinofuranosidase C-terminal domain-containing protein [Chitinophaga sp. CF118]SFD61628.1 Alpha-L-arabinofuranosidase C-terminus [Chitinophaga sp. CF118]